MNQATCGKGLLVGALLLAAGCGEGATRPGVGGGQVGTLAVWSAPVPVDLQHLTDNPLRRAVEKALDEQRQAPESPRAVGQLGHVYLAHGWEEEAAECYRRAVALAPHDYRWYYYLGRAAGTSHAAEAAEALMRSVELRPDHAAGHLFCARALKKLGQADEAREHFRRALELNPRDALAEQGLGELDLASGELESAKQHLLRAVAINPNQKEAHGALASTYMALGDRASAERHSAEAEKTGEDAAIVDPLWAEIQKAGATADWYAMRGAILLSQQQFEQALAELEQAASPTQDDARFWLNYGACLVNLRRYSEAMAPLERALSVRPNHKERKLTDDLRSQVHVNLGIAKAQMGNLNSAREHLEQALKLAPNSILAVNNLAILYYKQGRLSEAMELVKQLQARRPNPRTAQILEQLRAESEKRPPRR